MTIFFSKSKNLKDKEILEFSKEMYYLLKVDIGIIEALNIISNNYKNDIKNKIIKCKKYIEKGNSLEKSFLYISKNQDFIQMIKIAEKTGKLSEVFKNIYLKYEFREKIKKEVKSLSIYPIFVIITAIIIIFILLKVVVPKFVLIYEDMGQKLPTVTENVILISKLINKYWFYMLFILGIIFLFFRNYIKNNKINYEKNILKIKIIGKIYREIKILDFSQNMYSLLCSKIELIQALELCFKNTEGFFKKELEKIVVKLKKGKEITKSFGNSAFFDREYISFLNIGEKTGDMETAFSNLTEIYYDRVNEKIKLFLKILEPVSIIIIGIIIGFIVFSVMMPIFKMSEGL